MSSLLHVVWPSSCPVCGRLTVKVCPECLDSLAARPSKFCLACGADDPCESHPGGLVCCAASRYGGANRDVVHAMKYGSGKSVAVMMGEIIACLFEVPDADFLVPVPLHKGSVREYNQTELIAKGASNVWGIPVKNSLRWRVVRDSQASSPDLESRNLSSDAMEAIVEVKLDGVFIVDDVCTTGNTLIAAAAALRSAGASVGGALVWSRGI